MDESEIWLSDEDEGEFDEGDEATTDPTFFSIGLTSQGQPGGKSNSTYFLLTESR
jgi:hypothetical protein